eukprot:Hpha_TRINITY_DN12025_c0_g1::TRINITY_DN12025_c0_g1_i1::g.141068::m.141068
MPRPQPAMEFSDPTRDPGHVWPRYDVAVESKVNRSKRAPKIDRWNNLLSGTEERSPRRPVRQSASRFTRDQAAEKLAAFQRGSMKRSGIMLTCHCTGCRFAPTELVRGADARQELVEKALKEVGVPEDLISFRPPEMPPPSMLNADDLQGDQGKEFTQQANTYNDEALENFRGSMERIMNWAKQNLPDGPATVNQAMGSVAAPARSVSAKFGCHPPKIEVKYPDAPTRKRMFHDTDQNGNGILSLAELDLAVKTRWPKFDHKNAVIRAYKLADKKGTRDGWLTRSDDDTKCEWSHFLKYLSLYNYYWHKFAAIDLNHDLSVDINEWRANANAIFELEGDEALLMDELDVVFQEMDVDGSGRVRFDEFCIWAAKVHGDRDLGSDQALVSSPTYRSQESRRWKPSRMQTFHNVRHQEGWNEGRPSPRQRGPATVTM